MGAKTGIEWTDATWNPLRGCSRVSEGCRNYYTEAQA
jgi:protein gp37